MSAGISDQALLNNIAAVVTSALAEDIGKGDLTAGLVPARQQVSAAVRCREDAVICGRPWFDEVFNQLSSDVTIHWNVAEGESAKQGGIVCRLEGPARPILTGERTGLNFLQTLSSTATAARRYVDAVAGTGARILDTRKTLPGLRLAQKYAVRMGGASNHRLGLYDAVLVKENHIVAAGGIGQAVREARQQTAGVVVEVEVENLAQLEEALKCGADRLLLDNFDTAMMRQAVKLRNAGAPGIKLEASGGIRLDTVREIAETGVDLISVGSLTKDIRAVDLSMRFQFV